MRIVKELIEIWPNEVYDRLVKEVLKRLQFNDLYAKAEKCFFEKSSIKYLGIIISENKVQMDEKKLLGVLEWLVSQTSFGHISTNYLMIPTVLKPA